MVARIRKDTDLVVMFFRDGERTEVINCPDGSSAWSAAIHMVARREVLRDGDCLRVRRAADEV